MHVLWWIVVGLIAGWATGKIMRGSGYGPVMDILVGIVGALVMRGIMILLGVTLVSRFHFILYIFGIFLVVTAIRMLFGKAGARFREESGDAFL